MQNVWEVYIETPPEPDYTEFLHYMYTYADTGMTPIFGIEADGTFLYEEEALWFIVESGKQADFLRQSDYGKLFPLEKYLFARDENENPTKKSAVTLLQKNPGLTLNAGLCYTETKLAQTDNARQYVKDFMWADDQVLNTNVEYLISGEHSSPQNDAEKENSRKLLHIYNSLSDIYLILRIYAKRKLGKRAKECDVLRDFLSVFLDCVNVVLRNRDRRNHARAVAGVDSYWSGCPPKCFLYYSIGNEDTNTSSFGRKVSSEYPTFFFVRQPNLNPSVINDSTYLIGDGKQFHPFIGITICSVNSIRKKGWLFINLAIIKRHFLVASKSVYSEHCTHCSYNFIVIFKIRISP